MMFARWVFRLAGIYGLLVLPLFYFMEEKIGRDDPPAITHPEYYYGFVGVGIAWQVAFVLIGQDPARYRPLMIPSVLEKVTFGVAAIVLFLQQRLAAPVLASGLLDLAMGALFIAAWWTTAATDTMPKKT